MQSRIVRVCNSKGFHLRPASKLVELVQQFPGHKATLTHPEKGNTADCMNMMSLMMITCPSGTELQLEVNGDREEQLAEAIDTLFSSGFCE